MLHISPIYLESATAAYADFFEATLHRDRLGTMGHWLGRGAAPLGLRNPVQLRTLDHLLNGLTPDGSRGLVQDAGDPKRIAGWRVVLSAPPLLNNVWGVAPREAQVRIERGFTQGVNRTLKCLEDVVTGLGTLAPRPETPKAVMAVFRTKAAADLSAELKSTTLLLNVDIQSPNKATTFSASQVMHFESGLRDFYVRALHARLQEQVGSIKSLASKALGVDRLIDEIFTKAETDARLRATWGRRDDRRVWMDQKTELSALWRAAADGMSFKACWTGNLEAIGKSGRMFANAMKELGNGWHANGHKARRIPELPKERKRGREAGQPISAAKKSREHDNGHYH